MYLVRNGVIDRPLCRSRLHCSRASLLNSAQRLRSTTSPIRSSIVLVLVLVLVLGFFWWGGVASVVQCVFFHRNSLLTSNGRKTDNENEHENESTNCTRLYSN